MKFKLITYGCTLNFCDSEIIRGILLNENFEEAETEEAADIVILNSCGVKKPTAQRIYDKLRQLRKDGKRAVVAGCLTADRKLIERAYPEISIIGVGSLTHVPDAVEASIRGKKMIFLSQGSKHNLPRAEQGAIAKIPIAEGCLGVCTYCFSRIARGKLRSYPSEFIKKELKRCVKNGAKEIQLTAQDTGVYGSGTDYQLPELLNELAKTKGDFRVRVGMINPKHAMRMRKRLSESIGPKKIFKFLHIPVQAGSDKVLKHMKRPYTSKNFQTLAKYFRKRFPEITIATDVIVGYPTETESDFKKTLSLLKKTKPDVVNLSKFGPRPFTEAAKLKPLSAQTINRRSREASKLIEKISNENAKEYIGKEMEIFVTEKGRTYKGRAENYRVVAVDDAMIGQKLKVKITDATWTHLKGRVLAKL